MSGLEAMRRWTTGLAIGVLSTLSACASDGGDVASREVVNITHSSTEPAGSLSVSDDGRHSFLREPPTTTEVWGRLSAAELAALRAQVANLQVQEQDFSAYPACMASENGYRIAVRGGSSGDCFEVNGTSSSAHQQAVDFLADFYQQKTRD